MGEDVVKMVREWRRWKWWKFRVKDDENERGVLERGVIGLGYP